MIYISGIAERLTIAISKHVSFLYVIKHFDIFFFRNFQCDAQKSVRHDYSSCETLSNTT